MKARTIIILVIAIAVNALILNYFTKHEPSKLSNWQLSPQLRLVNIILNQPENISTIISDSKISKVSTEADIRKPEYSKYVIETIKNGGFNNYKIDDIVIGDEYDKDSAYKSKLLVIVSSDKAKEKVWIFFGAYPKEDWKLQWIYIDPDTIKQNALLIGRE